MNQITPIAPFTPASAIEFLHSQAILLPDALKSCCLHVLDNPSFQTWVASIRKHHAYPGGLAVHTAEVLQFTLHIAAMNPSLDKSVLITAAIFHDFGKIWDYQPNPSNPEKPWIATEHYRLVNHITRSYFEFRTIAVRIPPHDVRDFAGWYRQGMSEEVRTAVEHCILAHHGCRNWGSPVEPQTQEAWTLHLADMASAQCMPSAPHSP